MEKYLLSDESIAILKNFALHSPIATSDIDFSCDSVQVLIDNKLIDYTGVENHNYSGHTLPVATEYSITELGKGYLAEYQRNIESLESVKKLAESACEQAKIANEQAKIASESSKTSGRQAEISITLSLIAIIVSILTTILQIIYG